MCLLGGPHARRELRRQPRRAHDERARPDWLGDLPILSIVGFLAMLGGGKPEFVTKAGFYFPEGI